MKSNILHDIKHRSSPNDEFFTPPELVKTLIPLVPVLPGDTTMDNAYGSGNWFSQLPGIPSYSTDFFNFAGKVDWFITNPPYSKLDSWLEHSTKHANNGFAYLFGLHNITPRRIELCENRDFHITSIHLSKVFQWFGISAFIVWERGKQGILSYDRTVWR
jgi:hypothetical protein